MDPQKIQGPPLSPLRGDPLRSIRFEDGTVGQLVGSDDDVARAAVFQSDGKLVLAGRSRTADQNYNRFAVARFWHDGSLDTSFDTDGIQVTEIWPNSWQWAHSVTIDNSDRIVAAGRVYDLQSYQFMVVRYETDGTLDTDFSGDGIATIEFGNGPNQSADFARAVKVQADNKIVVAGYAGKPGSYDLALARLNDDGSLDNTYDTDGKVIQSINAGNDLGLGMVLTTDSKAVVSGCSYNGSDCDLLIARFDANGDLDNGNFETDGYHYVDISSSEERGFGILLDTAHNYVVAGRTTAGGGGDWNFALMRFDIDGDLDAAFDTDGIQVSDLVAGDTDSAHSVAEDIAGNLLVGGRAIGTSANFVVARYDNAGDLDVNFETDGVAITDFSDGNHDYGITQVYMDNKVILVGSTNNGANRDMAIARYNSDGSLAASGDPDAWFSVDGEDTYDRNAGVDAGYSLAIQTDGKYLVGMAVQATNGDNQSYDFAVARYTTDGVLDSDFHTDGISEFYDRNGCRDELTDIAFQPGKGIVGTGRSGDGGCGNNTEATFAMRWDEDGDVDGLYTVSPQDLGTNDMEQMEAIAIQTDGKIITAGYRENGGGATEDYAVVRWDEDGDLDTPTFAGGAGFIVSDVGNVNDFDRAEDVEIRASDGYIFAMGWSRNNNGAGEDFSTQVYDEDGDEVTSWLTAFDVDAANRQERAYGSTWQTDGLLVQVGFAEVGGTNGAARDWAIARMNTVGTLDGNFETDGKHVIDITGNNDQAFDVCQDTQTGKLWVVGRANNNTGIARFLSDGSLDPSFDTDGIRTYNIGGTDRAEDCLVLSDGRLLVTGLTNNDAYVMRIWP